MYRKILLSVVIFIIAFLVGFLAGNVTDPGEQFTISGHLLLGSTTEESKTISSFLMIGSTKTEIANTSATFTYAIYYGGNFTINATRLINPIGPEGWCGAERSHTLNVTIWSPYGISGVSFINITIGSMIFEYNATTDTLTVKNIEGLISNYSISLTDNKAWVYVLLNITPTWNLSGVYDVWIYANDTKHNYLNETSLQSYLQFVNVTYLYDYSFNKSTYFPGDPGRLTLNITYNGTSTGVEGETLWVNGTQLTTDSLGIANYEFTAPSDPGTYTLNVTLDHGETYFINFTVSKIILHFSIRTETNKTIHLPSDVLIELYNYTTGELIGTYTIKETSDLDLNTTGTYLLKVWYNNMKIAEIVHNQTETEESLTITPIKQVVDHLGNIRGLLANVSLISYNFDNDTRKLNVILNGTETGRLSYIVNYTKPLLVLSNTTVNVQQLGGELLIDVDVPANVTILDPRNLKIVVRNPFNISFTPTIEFYNLTTWESLANGTLYEVPAQEETIIKISYKGMESTRTISLLEDINITAILAYDTFVDYRNKSREIIANTSTIYEDISPKFPYSKIRVLLNGTGKFKLLINYSTLPADVLIESNVSDLKYYWNENYLVLTGSLSSTGEINVAELYELKLTIIDRLKNYLSIELYINTTKYKGYSISDLLSVENYTIKIPFRWNGFEFYAYTDGYNKTERIITMDENIAFTIEYRVPTRVNITFVKTGETEDYVTGYFEVEVLDYYGNPVSNRNVTVILEWAGGTYRKIFTGTTDLRGVFTTSVTELYRDETYTVTGSFEGDDIYVGSTTESEVQVEALPEEEVEEISLWDIYKYHIYGIIILIVILIILGIIAILKRTRKIIREEKRYKYVEEGEYKYVE